MASAGPPSVLARIIAAHRPRPVVPPDRAPDAERVFGRALRHAATPFAGLNLSLAGVVFTGDGDLAGMIEALPEHALVAVTEDDVGRRGLMALSHGMIDALIEVQTTGRVERGAMPPRPVTRIDAAMVRDFMDLTLAAFTREAGSVALRDWPDRMRFGSVVQDRSAITLLLPDGGYHLLRADLGFGGTERRAEAMLVLPCDPALAARPDAEATAAPGAQAAWREGLTRSLGTAPLTLEAVLVRLTRPLGDVQGLKPGDLVPFAAGDAQNVRLEDGTGRAILAGRLGQISGKRAVRLTRTLAGAPALAPDSPVTRAAPPQPPLAPVRAAPEPVPAEQPAAPP